MDGDIYIVQSRVKLGELLLRNLRVKIWQVLANVQSKLFKASKLWHDLESRSPLPGGLGQAGHPSA